MDAVPLKKHIKLLIKTTFDFENSRLIPAKVSSILSQQNIYESNLVDDFVLKFFSKLEFAFSSPKIYRDFMIPVVINIYKKKNKSDIIILNPSFSIIFKRLLDVRYKLLRKTELPYTRGFFSPELIKIVLIRFLYYSDLNFSISSFKNCFIFLKGLLYSLKLRSYMKSRKINFRRKIRKDSEGNIIK